jgi:putative phosphoesterase
MRVAIISDVHGELYPLDLALKDIRSKNVDQVVCLGDAIQGGSQPAETVARLREISCLVVMGNADAWLLTGKETEEKASERQRKVRAWSLDHLSGTDLEYIKSFRPTVEINLGNEKKLLCFHGSPRSFDDVIEPSTSDETVYKFLSGFEATLFAGGHTHTQQIRRVGCGWYVNPGSVSLAYNWTLSDLGSGRVIIDPWSEYCVVASEENRLGVEFRRVPFDLDEFAQIIRSSGRPYAEDVISQYRKIYMRRRARRK